MISETLIWIGGALMVMGSFLSVFEKRFLVKLHKIGVSDAAGTILVMLGIAMGNFEVPKTLLTLLFILIWNPVVTHAISKLYVSRLRR